MIHEGGHELGRAALAQAIDGEVYPDHAGWLLDHGLIRRDGGERGGNIQWLIDRATELPCGEMYRLAYRRWERETQETSRHACWTGQLRGRMLIGIGQADKRPTVLLHHSYGVPIIHGSQLKGLARAFAQSAAGRHALGAMHGLLSPWLVENQLAGEVAATIDILFGRGPESAGYLTFHDAWWVPDTDSVATPLAAEVITPHHRSYYSNKGDVPPSDMESPSPVQLVAVRGALRFVVEGSMPWASWGRSLLRAALCEKGAGAQTHADYGVFEATDPHLSRPE